MAERARTLCQLTVSINHRKMAADPNLYCSDFMKYFGEAHTLLYVKDKNTVALIKPVIEKFFND